MADHGKHPRESGTSANALDRRRRIAWILILIVDAGFVAWGAMAAAWLDHLLGPGGKPILIAGCGAHSRPGLALQPVSRPLE